MSNSKCNGSNGVNGSAGSKGDLIRRNIHTYPFKYTYTQATDYFRPDNAAIYIHIPFCSTKCHFCDYTVYVNSSGDLREAYVAALCAEIERFRDNRAFPGFVVDAVYFGGGTPGLLEADQLIRVLDVVRSAYELSADCEIGIEFDPRSVSFEKLHALHQAGFRRLSIGVQSFDDQILRDTNRPHVLEDVYRSVEQMRAAGFAHTNLDLIYPLLGLTTETWADSIEKAIALKPACITAYPLEVWPKTAYFHQIVQKGHRLPTAGEELEMARVAFDLLEAAGYVRASTSGYYHPERAPGYCRFLDYYWKTWPMIGFGVSSKSVIYDRLYTNIKPIRQYIESIETGGPVLDFSTRMNREQEMRRFAIRCFKMCEVSKPEFAERFGVALRTVFGAQLDRLLEDGFIAEDETRFYLTRKGQVVSNNVYEAFYVDDDLRPPRSGEVQFGISQLIMQ